MAETVASVLQHKGSDIWWISPDASVFDAIALMAGKSVGAVLVMDQAQLLGIVSERDYARKVILQGRSSKETRVADVMTAPVITVTPRTTVHECMEIVTLNRIRHLPVVDADRVVGIVSIGDLVRKIVATHEETIHHLHEYIVGSQVTPMLRS
jgi:signal-transduction protein with cAMP-binding, CBS, and nucleotidyltransferase domain